MASFRILNESDKYDVYEKETGRQLATSITGKVAMTREWPEGAEAWVEGDVNNEPFDHATKG